MHGPLVRNTSTATSALDVTTDSDQLLDALLAHFADIFADAVLPSGVVPSLAFVDPNNPNILYFFLDKTLFALDAQARQVLHHMEYSLDPDYYGQLRVRYSCFVDAWVLPPTLLRKGDPHCDFVVFHLNIVP